LVLVMLSNENNQNPKFEKNLQQKWNKQREKHLSKAKSIMRRRTLVQENGFGEEKIEDDEKIEEDKIEEGKMIWSGADEKRSSTSLILLKAGKIHIGMYHQF